MHAARTSRRDVEPAAGRRARPGQGAPARPGRPAVRRARRGRGQAPPGRRVPAAARARRRPGAGPGQGRRAAAARRRPRLRQRLPDLRRAPLVWPPAAGRGRRPACAPSASTSAPTWSPATRAWPRSSALGGLGSWPARSPTPPPGSAPSTSCSPCTPATPRPTTRSPAPCAGARRSCSPRPAATTTSSASSAAQAAGHPPPHPYTALTRHGILRERFADVLTDALRADLLRLLGYRVDVVEFVDSRHTPRNALIRAERTGAQPDPRAGRSTPTWSPDGGCARCWRSLWRASCNRCWHPFGRTQDEGDGRTPIPVRVALRRRGARADPGRRDPGDRGDRGDRGDLGDGNGVSVDRTLRDARITESSGLVASRLHAGVLWTHNDSGNPPVLYALGRNGSTVATIRVSGAANVDWEALAPVAGTGGRSLLAIGDIGDNSGVRSRIEIDLVAEPDPLRSVGRGRSGSCGCATRTGRPTPRPCSPTHVPAGCSWSRKVCSGRSSTPSR